MRTTLDLDDDLVGALLRRHPDQTKTAAIETAIRDHLARASAEALIAAAGTIDFDEDFLAAMDEAERRSLTAIWEDLG